MTALEATALTSCNTIEMSSQTLSLRANLKNWVQFGGRVPLTGWTDNDIIRNCCSALIPGCALIDPFVGLRLPFTHDVDREGS